MSTLQDIIHPDEEILWSEKPKWTGKKSGFDFLKNRALALGFAFSVFVAACCLFVAGLEGVGGTLIFMVIIAVFAIFSTPADESEKHDSEYVITNHRLLIMREDNTQRVSVALASISAIESRSNGIATDLTIRIGQKKYDYVTLHALTNSLLAESLIVKHFS